MKKTLLSILCFSGMITAGFAQCFTTGNGSDGAYSPSVSTTLAGGTYNYTSITIPAGVTVTITGTSPLVMFCTGTATINGALVANGGNGTNGITFSGPGFGGIGVAGGGDGGNGVFSASTGPLPGVAGGGTGGANTQGNGWSGGGGAGYATTGSSSGNSAGGFGGAAYGSATISPMVAGSGGGGGSGGYNCGSGGGGAGGGSITINANSLIIGATGVIRANGGNGGSDGTGNCGGGGGGSGGSIWLSAASMTHNGVLSATGGTGGASNIPGSPYYGVGAAGANGRIRLDYNGTLGGSGTSNPAVGYTSTISSVQTAAVVTSNVTCFGGNDGAALATNMNGNPPYTQVWSPSGGTSTTASGLTAGTYTYTVTDANGCTASTSVTITQPPQITATVSATNVSCFGGADGCLTVTTSGGVAPYSYNWSPTGGTADTACGLSAGCYTVLITDANGCTATATGCVTQPTPLVATATAGNVSCFGACDGILTGMAAGGTPAYTYMWVPGNYVTQTVTGVCAGCYTLTVTDANGCVAMYTICVTQPPMATVNVLGNDTTICLNAVYNLCAPAGYSAYLWNTSSTAMCINADTTMCYSVLLTDSSGCTITDTICVLEDPCLGIGIPETPTFSFYPNPANTFIIISHGMNEAQLVKVFDINGKVCVAEMVKDKEQLNISTLAEGIYAIQIGNRTEELLITR